jgi:hypothetical protein
MEKTGPELTKIRKTSGIFALNLVLGCLGVLLSLNVWATYIFMTAWIGFVIGILAGPGWSDHLLGRTPPHRQSTRIQRTVGGIVVFWFPCLAVFVLSLVVAKTLPDATRPQSSLDGKGISILFQSAAMYFNAIGATWLCVWADVKKLVESESESESESDQPTEGTPI